MEECTPRRLDSSQTLGHGHRPVPRSPPRVHASWRPVLLSSRAGKPAARVPYGAGRPVRGPQEGSFPESIMFPVPRTYCRGKRSWTWACVVSARTRGLGHAMPGSGHVPHILQLASSASLLCGTRPETGVNCRPLGRRGGTDTVLAGRIRERLFLCGPARILARRKTTARLVRLDPPGRQQLLIGRN